MLGEPLKHIGSEVRDLESRVERVRRLEEQSIAALRTWRAVAIGVCIVALLAVLEALSNWSALTRSTIALLAVLAGGITAVQVILPLLRSWNILEGVSLLEVARRIGAAFPPIRDRLFNVLQMSSGPADAGWVSADLTGEAIRVLHRDIALLDLASSVDGG